MGQPSRGRHRALSLPRWSLGAHASNGCSEYSLEANGLKLRQVAQDGILCRWKRCPLGSAQDTILRHSLNAVGLLGGRPFWLPLPS